MNILTVVTDPDKNWNRLAKIWLYFARKNCPEAIIYAGDIGMSNDLIKYFKKNGVIILPKKAAYKDYGKTFWEHCLYYKPQFLCDFPEPVIFVDIDALILKNLSPLWNLRNEKPLIAVHFDNDEKRSINTGVILVGKPGFLCWSTLKAFADKKSWDFKISEQDLLDQYLRSIGYKPKHELIDSSFNAWALDMKWRIKGKQIVCDSDVYIAHFAGLGGSKPWQLENAKALWFYKFPGIQQPQTKMDKLLEIIKTRDMKRLLGNLKWYLLRK